MNPPPNDPGDTPKRLFNADLGDDHQSSLKFTDNDEILHVRGVMVDRIVSIGDPLDLMLASLAHYSPGDYSHEHYHKVHSSQLAFINKWKCLCLDLSGSTYRPTGGSMLDAFWRTIFLDRNIIHSINGPALARLPEVVHEGNIKRVFGWHDGFKFPPENDEQESEVLSYLRFILLELWNFNRLNPYCVNLRFFTTCQGYIGVGHPNYEPGDNVAVLLGSSVPLILREFPEGHTLIGESYVHGIMDGEIMQGISSTDEDTNKDILQWFTIV